MVVRRESKILALRAASSLYLLNWPDFHAVGASSKSVCLELLDMFPIHGCTCRTWNFWRFAPCFLSGIITIVLTPYAWQCQLMILGVAWNSWWSFRQSWPSCMDKMVGEFISHTKTLRADRKPERATIKSIRSVWNTLHIQIESQ